MAVIYKAITTAIDTLKSASGLATIKTHTVYTPALKNGTVIDLGANVGEFSIAMAQRGLTCHSIEAEPDVFKQIPEMKGIKKHNIAISNRNEPVQLFISENHECNSVAPAIATSYGLKGRITCPGMTLKKFLAENDIDRISLLKVDIEGSEEQLFDSTPDDVLERIDQITIEFHDFVPGSISAEKVSQITQRLERLGFYRLPFSYIFPHMMTADILFIRLKNVPAHSRVYFSAINALLSIQKAKSRLTNH